MTGRIRKLAKLYEEVSYQAMKEAFEEEWKASADWSKEERISFALFVIRLMIVKEDFSAAEKFSTKHEEFSKYKEIIDKNKAEIAKQYEDSDKSVEEKKGEYACVYLDYDQPSAFGASYYCHKKDIFCTGFTTSCDGYETWKNGSDIKNKEEKHIVSETEQIDLSNSDIEIRNSTFPKSINVSYKHTYYRDFIKVGSVDNCFYISKYPYIWQDLNSAKEELQFFDYKNYLFNFATRDEYYLAVEKNPDISKESPENIIFGEDIMNKKYRGRYFYVVMKAK